MTTMKDEADLEEGKSPRRESPGLVSVPDMPSGSAIANPTPSGKTKGRAANRQRKAKQGHPPTGRAAESSSSIPQSRKDRISRKKASKQNPPPTHEIDERDIPSTTEQMTEPHFGPPTGQTTSQPGAYRSGEQHHVSDEYDDNFNQSNSHRNSKDMQGGHDFLVAATLVEENDDTSKIIAEATPLPRWNIKWVVFGILFLLACVAVAVIVPLVVIRNQQNSTTDATTEPPMVEPTPAPTETPLNWMSLGQTVAGKSFREAFGASVALSLDGRILASGAYLNSDNDQVNAGTVRVFNFDGSEWNQLGGDIPSSEPNSNFGFSVALSGDGRILAAGGFLRDSFRGFVRTYRWDDFEWQPLGQFLQGAPLDSFGAAVSLSKDGQTLAVGAPQLDRGDDRPGYVGIYRLRYGSWFLDEKFVGDGFNCLVSRRNPSVRCDEFGTSVSLSHDGNTLAVGGHRNDNEFGTDAGHARVFHWVEKDDEWIQIGEDIQGRRQSDRLGYSVSLSPDGNTVAVGAIQDGAIADRAGYVRVLSYNATNNTWLQQGKEILGDRGDDWFGNAVALTYDERDNVVVAAGARFHDGNGTDTGHVRVHVFDGENWNQDGADIEGAHAGDRFGKSVAFSNGARTLAIGADQDSNLLGSLPGLVAVYCSGSKLPTPSPTPAPSAAPTMSMAPTTTLHPTGEPGSENPRPPPPPPPVEPSSPFVAVLGSSRFGASADDNFGFSVALSSNGNMFAGGAWSFGADSPGYLRVLQWNDTSNDWFQLGNEIGGATDEEREGLSLALSDGRTLASGSAARTNAGRVRVRYYDSAVNDWKQSGGDLVGDNIGDNFGAAISMDELASRLAVGAPQFDSGDSIGYVRLIRQVFVFPPIEVGQGNASDTTTLLTPPPPPTVDWEPVEGIDLRGQAPGDMFGFSVSMSGDGTALAVGAPGSSGEAGQVRVFRLMEGGSNISFVPFGSPLIGNNTGDWFGSSVSMNFDGSCVAVGAPQTQAPGYTRVSCWDAESMSWLVRGRDLVGDSARDAFGTAVSMSSDASVLVVGGPGNDRKGSNSGIVRVYVFDEWSNDWIRFSEAYGSSAGDNFGSALAVSSDGTRFVGGAPFHDGDTGLGSGQVLAFENLLFLFGPP